MIHKIEFSQKERNGKMSLWVSMDGDTPYHISDIPKSMTSNENVQFAIRHAFELGWMMCRDAHSTIDYKITQKP